MLRDDLDTILSFIGAASLTDDEYDVADGMIDTPSNSEEVYTALLAVLDSRELVSTMAERLRYYYLAKGIVFGEINHAKSNVFVGSEI